MELTGLPETDTLILHQLDDESLFHSCISSKYVFSLCKRDPLLYQRTMQYKQDYDHVINQRRYRYNFEQQQYKDFGLIPYQYNLIFNKHHFPYYGDKSIYNRDIIMPPRIFEDEDYDEE